MKIGTICSFTYTENLSLFVLFVDLFSFYKIGLNVETIIKRLFNNIKCQPSFARNTDMLCAALSALVKTHTDVSSP